MRGVTIYAVAFVAALLFNLPAAEAGNCHGGGGGAVFSFTAPQAFVAPVHTRQAFVAAPVVRQRVVAQRFVAQPVVAAVNVGHGGVAAFAEVPRRTPVRNFVFGRRFVRVR